MCCFSSQHIWHISSAWLCVRVWGKSRKHLCVKAAITYKSEGCLQSVLCEMFNKQQFCLYFSFHSTPSGAGHVALHDAWRIKWLHVIETLLCLLMPGGCYLFLYFSESSSGLAAVGLYVCRRQRRQQQKLRRKRRVSFQLRRRKSHTCAENTTCEGCDAVWSTEVTVGGGADSSCGLVWHGSKWLRDWHRKLTFFWCPALNV